MNLIMKKEESATVHMKGFLLKYRLTCDDNGWYGIECRCRKNGKQESEFVNEKLFASQATARRIFRILVDNEVFPVHIPDILYDFTPDAQELSPAIA